MASSSTLFNQEFQSNQIQPSAETSKISIPTNPSSPLFASAGLVTPPLYKASPQQVLQTQLQQFRSISQPQTPAGNQTDHNNVLTTHVLLPLLFISNLQHLSISREEIKRNKNCGLNPPGIILVPSVQCCRTFILYAPKLNKEIY